MKNNTEYERLINGISEDNFNSLIKEYAKEYYNTNELHISNGPYDGGLDLTYFKDEKQVKRNVQITVQKTQIEKKLREDLNKSKDNVDDYNYLANLDFYISQTISPTKKQKFERIAEAEYGITLKIVDAAKLAGNMDEFPSIKQTLKVLYEINDYESIFNLSKKNKVMFNVIASGEDSTKIKRHLLQAFILSTLFESSEISLDNLYNTIKETITLDLNKDVIFKEVNFLKSKNKVVGKDYFSLSEDTNKQLQDILDLNELQEKELNDKLSKILETEGLEDKSEEITRKLIEMYIQHFNFDLEDFDSETSSFQNSSRKVYDELCALLRESGLEEKGKCFKVSQEILNITASNEFLTKIGASSMFVKLYNSNKLESYINNSQRSVCLDTQVLLRLLYNAYNPETEDRSLKAIDNLINAIDKSSLSMYLFTTIEYIEELTAHLQRALKIYNYISLPLFKNVGRSRNVFYNYYKEQLQKKNIQLTNFRDFIESELLGISLPDEFGKDFLKVGIPRISSLFQTLGYDVIDPGFYSNLPELQKEFEINLSYSGKRRSRRAIIHDVRTSIYLSDENNHFDPKEEIFLEPYLITWDLSFFDLRAIAKKEIQGFSHWFIYTPEKFVEKIYLSHFKVKSDAINETILSIVESDFNSTNSKKTFLDVISSIFNKEDVSKLKLAQKFVDIEEEYLQEREPEEEFKMIVPEESPLTIILGILIDNYNRKDAEKNMDDFSALLEKDSLADKILSVIDKSIKALQRKELNREQLIASFDDLMNADA